MSGLNGYALTQEFETDLISAYAASMQEVPAVSAAPGWFVVGAFRLPKSLERCRLEVIALVSDAGLTGTARLYDCTAEAPVSGSEATFTGVGGTAAYQSGIVGLSGNRVFLVQCQVVGAAGVDKFGVVETASLIDP